MCRARSTSPRRSAHYVDHQLEVVRRRSKFRLEIAEARAHIVEGLLKALDKIDAIIKLIRGSADRDDARKKLMAAPLKFSEIQANYILDMPLARLTRLGVKELQATRWPSSRRTIKDLQVDPGQRSQKLRSVIKDELEVVEKKFGDERRTALAADVGDMNIEDLIADEQIVVVRTDAGYIKTVAGRQVPHAGARGPRRAGREPEGGRSGVRDRAHDVRTRTCCFSRTRAACSACELTRSR